LCPMFYLLCPMFYLLCPMFYLLCPMLHMSLGCPFLIDTTVLSFIKSHSTVLLTEQILLTWKLRLIAACCRSFYRHLLYIYFATNK
jgi:hypothetical protein